MPELVIIAHNLRSVHNVGSLLRTAEGLGIDCVWLTGHTPYPTRINDVRLPHISAKMTKQIHKTALGAEDLQSWRQSDDVKNVIAALSHKGFVIAALEQTPNAVKLPEFRPPTKLALILGRETAGLEPEIIKLCNTSLEIPMYGQKESFNVVQAAAMAMYHCRFPTSQ